MVWRHALPKHVQTDFATCLQPTDRLRWISIRVSTPRSCVWRLVDAGLHLVDSWWHWPMALAHGIGTEPWKASNHTKLSTFKKLFGGSNQSQETCSRHVPGRTNLHMTAQALASAGLVNHSYPLEKIDIWQWQIHLLHMVFLDFPLAWPAWLCFSRKAKQNHSESPWGKLQFLIPPQKSHTHGRKKTPGPELSTLTLSTRRVLHRSKLPELSKPFLKSVRQWVNPQISSNLEAVFATWIATYFHQLILSCFMWTIRPPAPMEDSQWRGAVASHFTNSKILVVESLIWVSDMLWYDPNRWYTTVQATYLLFANSFGVFW